MKGGEKAMDFATVLQAIATVGFPIVMCMVLMWYIKDTNDKHKEETKQFTEALNKNTLVLQKLCDNLGVESEV